MTVAKQIFKKTNYKGRNFKEIEGK